MKKREKVQYAVAAALALAGVVFIMVRLWGMRFSGFLLLGTALALALSALLDLSLRHISDGKTLFLY